MPRIITAKEATTALKDAWFGTKFKDMKPSDYQVLYKTMAEIESGIEKPARILEVYRRLVDSNVELALVEVKK